MEVITLYRFKKMGFSLEELGYKNGLDETMAQDLIYLENCINEASKSKTENNFNKMKR